MDAAARGSFAAPRGVRRFAGRRPAYELDADACGGRFARQLRTGGRAARASGFVRSACGAAREFARYDARAYGQHPAARALQRNPETGARVRNRPAELVAEPHAADAGAAARKNGALLSWALHHRCGAEGRYAADALQSEPNLPKQRAGKFARAYLA